MIDLTNDKLGELEIQLDGMGDEKRTCLSRTRSLLADLMFVVKNPVFECMMVVEDGFEFNIPALLEFDIVEGDRENNILYLELLEMIHRLPKQDITDELFDDFLDNQVESVAALCPLFLQGEFHWILDRGSEYRTRLAYCLVPGVNHERSLTIEIDRTDILGTSMEQILSASVDELRQGFG